MRASRFTIASLFAATTVVALACAALANANTWWWSLVYTVAFLSIVVSCVTAIFAQGGTRAFAVGVVLTTIFYGYHFVAPYLLSDRLLVWIQPALAAEADYKTHFELIWNTIWGGPFTFFGGFCARYVYLRRFQVRDTTDLPS